MINRQALLATFRSFFNGSKRIFWNEVNQRKFLRYPLRCMLSMRRQPRPSVPRRTTKIGEPIRSLKRQQPGFCRASSFDSLKTMRSSLHRSSLARAIASLVRATNTSCISDRIHNTLIASICFRSSVNWPSCLELATSWQAQRHQRFT